jgi:hypothetical protein
MPAQALTMQECSVKYKAAESSGALGGMSWNQFRRAQCGPGASMAPAPSAATTGVAPSAAPSRSQAAAPSNNPYNARASAPSYGSGNIMFPNSVSPKYANMSAGKARMQTCLDQYRINKANGTVGDLKWIEKGGGYYSECNRRLSQR